MAHVLSFRAALNPYVALLGARSRASRAHAPRRCLQDYSELERLSLTRVEGPPADRRLDLDTMSLCRVERSRPDRWGRLM
jgi:hypothetical protein